MNLEHTTVTESLRRDWERTGGLLSVAMLEVSFDLGGEEFSRYVAGIAAGGAVLPDPAAFKVLEDLFPGSAGRVMDRAAEIQTEIHALELAALQRPDSAAWGRLVLGGLAKLNPFGHGQRT